MTTPSKVRNRTSPAPQKSSQALLWSLYPLLSRNNPRIDLNTRWISPMVDLRMKVYSMCLFYLHSWFAVPFGRVFCVVCGSSLFISIVVQEAVVWKSTPLLIWLPWVLGDHASCCREHLLCAFWYTGRSFCWCKGKEPFLCQGPLEIYNIICIAYEITNLKISLL